MDSLKNNRGFSLIELLVVLVILGLLAGIVGPQVLKHVGRAKSDSARLQIQDLSAALDLYYLEIGDYPSSKQGLDALIKAPLDVENWNGPYLKKQRVPTDPWNREFHYIYPGQHGIYDLHTLGRDNQEGGTKEDADIVSWE
jgi:general secretion pathway protein G